MNSLCFGEIIWDRFDDGEQLGGAPLNVAVHLGRLGVESFLVSAVGDDELGRRALDRLKSEGVDTRLVSVNEKHTGTAEVKEGSFVIPEDSAWDSIVLPGKGSLPDALDIFYFGTLSQRSNKEVLDKLVTSIRARCIFLDLNLREPFYTQDIIEDSLKLCNILKVNHEEAMIVSEMVFGESHDVKEIAIRLSDKYDIDVVVITNGVQGSQVYHAAFDEISAFRADVADEVGAGDAYSAGFLYAYMNGKPVRDSAVFASRLGAFVASRKGALPSYTAELAKELKC